MKLNTRRTTKNVSERMELLGRAYRMAQAWNFISIDEKAWKVIINPHKIKGKFAEQIENTLTICIADINAIEHCTARQCFIENFCRFTESRKRFATEKAKKMGYSITQYNLYKRMGILNFAEIHRGGELQVWEPYQSIKKELT